MFPIIPDIQKYAEKAKNFVITESFDVMIKIFLMNCTKDIYQIYMKINNIQRRYCNC